MKKISKLFAVALAVCASFLFTCNVWAIKSYYVSLTYKDDYTHNIGVSLFTSEGTTHGYSNIAEFDGAPKDLRYRGLQGLEEINNKCARLTELFKKSSKLGNFELENIQDGKNKYKKCVLEVDAKKYFSFKNLIEHFQKKRKYDLEKIQLFGQLLNEIFILYEIT